MGSEVDKNIGFGRSDIKTYTIANGATSSERVDLDRPYAFIVIMCENCDNIASSTNLTLNVSPEENIPLHALHTQNNPGTAWSKGPLPTTAVSFYSLVSDAFGSRFVQPVLSNAASGGTVVLKVIGYDPTVISQPDR